MSKIKRKIGDKEKSAIYNRYMSDVVSGNITLDELSIEYGRPKATIEKAVRDYSATLESDMLTNATADVTGGLHSKHFWSELRKQLLDNELNYFEKSWVKLVKQFSQYEIVETDEMIMKDLILQDILSNRKLRDIKRIDQELEFLQKNVDAEFEKSPDKRDQAKIEKWWRDISQRRGELETLDKTYASLQQRKETKFRDMKSTRDKRFKEIEDSKKTFFALIKALDAVGKRKEEGEWLALMKKSVEKETVKLGSSHKYADDSYDQPLLSADTV